MIYYFPLKSVLIEPHAFYNLFKHIFSSSKFKSIQLILLVIYLLLFKDITHHPHKQNFYLNSLLSLCEFLGNPSLQEPHKTLEVRYLCLPWCLKHSYSMNNSSLILSPFFFVPVASYTNHDLLCFYFSNLHISTIERKL